MSANTGNFVQTLLSYVMFLIWLQNQLNEFAIFLCF